MRPRRGPWLVVDVYGSPAGDEALRWALREAARREGTILAVSVLEDDLPEPAEDRRWPARPPEVPAGALEARVRRIIAATAVRAPVRTCLVSRSVFDALAEAARGADLVIVEPDRKTLLRPARPPLPQRPLIRGA